MIIMIIMTKARGFLLAVAVAAMAFTYVPVFAQQEQNKKVSDLIRKDVKRNKEEIQKEAFYLSEADRASLYDKHRKKVAFTFVWATLDHFPGFGLGSFIQGDNVFGFTQLGVDALAYTLMIAAIINDKDVGLNDEAFGLFLSGVYVFGASRVLSWIFPFVYQSRYNRHLRAALKPESFAYSIDPLLVTIDGIPAIGLAFNVRY